MRSSSISSAEGVSSGSHACAAMRRRSLISTCWGWLPTKGPLTTALPFARTREGLSEDSYTKKKCLQVV
jgi:hypothetical protein